MASAATIRPRLGGLDPAAAEPGKPDEADRIRCPADDRGVIGTARHKPARRNGDVHRGRLIMARLHHSWRTAADDQGMGCHEWHHNPARLYPSSRTSPCAALRRDADRPGLVNGLGRAGLQAVEPFSSTCMAVRDLSLQVATGSARFRSRRPAVWPGSTAWAPRASPL